MLANDDGAPFVCPQDRPFDRLSNERVREGPRTGESWGAERGRWQLSKTRVRYVFGWGDGGNYRVQGRWATTSGCPVGRLGRCGPRCGSGTCLPGGRG